MTPDTYTKAVLTVIALALVVIAFRMEGSMLPEAQAQTAPADAKQPVCQMNDPLHVVVHGADTKNSSGMLKYGNVPVRVKMVR